MNEAPTLKDLYLAQVVTLAHVLKAAAEAKGGNVLHRSFGLYLDDAEKALRDGSRELLERRSRSA